MNIGTTQSQTLISSLQFSSTTMKMPLAAPKKNEAASGSPLDVVEVGTQVDANFATRVLQDSLEERLNAAFESAGVNSTATSLLSGGMDFSPQATAGRIVDFAVSFYNAYQLNNQGEEGATQLAGFVDLIKGAVKEGFAGARELLGNFGEMSEGIQGNIDETFELTMKGIDDFAEEQRERIGQEEETDKEVAVL